MLVTQQTFYAIRVSCCVGISLVLINLMNPSDHRKLRQATLRYTCSRRRRGLLCTLRTKPGLGTVTRMVSK